MQQSSKQKEEGFVAPENFAMVERGVYRSAFPRSKNIPFLRRLGLKSVVSLVPEEYPPKLLEFYESSGIVLRSHGLDGNKWPFKEIDMISLIETMHDVLNESYRPLLIHCNKGKHRTGTVVGCLRKIRGWALTSIFHEYLFYANPKSRLEDQRMIESFQFQPKSEVIPEPSSTSTVAENDLLVMTDQALEERLDNDNSMIT